MISVNEIKNGMTLSIDGNLFIVTWFQHVKPGKGGGFMKTKLKNLKTGAVLERTFRSVETVEQVVLDEKEMEYLYKDDEHLWFMDTTSYEQVPIASDVIGEGVGYLKENMRVQVVFYEGKIVGIELPTFVELKVVQTEPGFKGDTVTGSYKPATMETGIVVHVPLFIKEGDLLKIDTRSGEYIQRA
jgi:elongation factor P